MVYHLFLYIYPSYALFALKGLNIVPYNDETEAHNLSWKIILAPMVLTKTDDALSSVLIFCGIFYYMYGVFILW